MDKLLSKPYVIEAELHILAGHFTNVGKYLFLMNYISRFGRVYMRLPLVPNVGKMVPQKEKWLCRCKWRYPNGHTTQIHIDSTLILRRYVKD